MEFYKLLNEILCIKTETEYSFVRQSEEEGLEKTVYLSQHDGVWFIYQITDESCYKLGALISEELAVATAKGWLWHLSAVSENGTPQM